MARTKVFVDIVTKSDGKEPGAGLKKFAIGAGIAAVAVAGLIKVGKELVNIFSVQEQAEAKLTQTIKATGQAAGFTNKALFDMANGLQEVTKFGDEAIIGAESLLLTFKDIGGDIFPRALESILDVSEAMGTDLQASTIQLGKALNDPILGLTSLSRSGIQFTDSQKETIKTMVEMGDKAGAQVIILEELESQFGGVARAAADTATGSLTQLNNVYGDSKELLGQILTEGIQPFVEGLKDELIAVNNSIKGHFLRGKALRGEATVIEELILRELEQEKTENRLAQGKENLVRAEQKLLEIGEDSDAVSNARRSGLTKGIEQAKNLLISLEDELVLRRLSTDTAQKQFDSEQKLLDVKLAAFEAITDINEGQEKENENKKDAIEINTELFATEERINLLLIERDEQRTIATSRALNGIEQEQEAIEKLTIDYQALANDGIGAFASSFEASAEAGLSFAETIKEAGKDAISAILKGLAQEALARAALALAIPFGAGIPSAALYTAAAAGAFAASGLVQSFQTGGQFITDGPTLVGGNLVGDNASGQERVTVEPLGGGGGTNNTGQIMILRIGDRDIKAVVQGWIDNRGLHRSQGGII